MKQEIEGLEEGCCVVLGEVERTHAYSVHAHRKSCCTYGVRMSKATNTNESAQLELVLPRLSSYRRWSAGGSGSGALKNELRLRKKRTKRKGAVAATPVPTARCFTEGPQIKMYIFALLRPRSHRR